MKTQIRLNSIAPDNISGPEAAALDAIYYHMLKEFDQRFYSYICINHVEASAGEALFIKGKKVHLNMPFEVEGVFANKTLEEKNAIRLEFVHRGLTRIAERDHKLDITVLENIRDKIIQRNFDFEFACKIFISKKNKAKLTISVKPQPHSFDYYIKAEVSGLQTCKLLLYAGLPSFFYFRALFHEIKWNSDHSCTITGKENNVAIQFNYREGKLEFINLTPYPKPPYFEVMRSDISIEDKEIARKNWMHSLPPALAAALNQNLN